VDGWSQKRSWLSGCIAIGLTMSAARSIAASQIAPAPMLSDHIGELVQGDANEAIETRQRDANDARIFVAAS
jgi:hypothetical protein